MAQTGGLLESTSEPGISVAALEPEVPSITVATIVGVSVVVLLAIAAVFIIGVLIDCRQQKILEQKMGQLKRLRKLRASKRSRDRDVITENMEEPGTSIPPAAALRNIP